jgi:hypothetical protein
VLPPIPLPLAGGFSGLDPHPIVTTPIGAHGGCTGD